MQRPIVVGVDGSEPALTAVRWAAREADRRRAPLRLLHVRPLPVPHGRRSDHLADERRRWLAGAEAVAAAAAPGVPVDTGLVHGRPASVLVEHSDNALLVVLGARGQNGIGGTVAARAACPVVISRDVAAAERVVVGVDGTAASESAIGFAFEAASSRRAPLRAVVAVTDLLADDLRERPLLVTDWTSVVEAQRRLVGERLAAWREKYPEVPVEPVVTRDSPVWSLVRSARRASLLVVGSHGHSAFTGRLLGSTSQALVRHAPCPLAVVRDDMRH